MFFSVLQPPHGEVPEMKNPQQLVGWYWNILIKLMKMVDVEVAQNGWYWKMDGWLDVFGVPRYPGFRKFPHLFGTCARSRTIWKIPWQGQQCKVVPTCANESAPWHSQQESLQCTWNCRMLPGNYFGCDLGMSIGDTSSTVSSSCSNRAEQLPATHWRSSCFFHDSLFVVNLVAFEFRWLLNESKAHRS